MDYILHSSTYSTMGEAPNLQPVGGGTLQWVVLFIHVQEQHHNTPFTSE
jgi:hypothetical protein